MVFQISNKKARHLWLSAQGLSTTPTGSLDTMAIIRQLGFIQLDTIRAVSRAHHHILWSRNQNYREPVLGKLLSHDRQIFEHFTHDASVLPMDIYPIWQRQYRNFRTKLKKSSWYSTMPNAKGRAAIKARIANEGPLCTKNFDTKAVSKGMWVRPPHKLALDYMWYVGDLATSHRENFSKFYDLTERVIPQTVREEEQSDKSQIDQLCRMALRRLVFGTDSDIMRFWQAVSLPEVRLWREQAHGLMPVEVETADGSWVNAFAHEDVEEWAQNVAPPTSRLRILNPFDPVIRDRKRLFRLFGMTYKIEIFVPAAKRQWGYYVFPVLEGDRFVGRLDMKAERSKGTLTILNFWPEPGVIWTPARYRKLEGELVRLCRFIGVDHVIWAGRGRDIEKTA